MSSEPLQTAIAENLAAVWERIRRSARVAGRDPGSVRLIAVSKTFGLEHVRAAASAGQMEFGENRVQEALDKIAVASDLQIRWHLVGHLQSNKAKRAAGVFSCIHSVDSVELLRRIDIAAGEQHTHPDLLVQVDLAGEPTKHGAAPESIREIFAAAAACQAARVVGLMVLPPLADDPEDARPYFRRIRQLRDELADTGVDPSMLCQLSMGMSHDLEIAVEEGSTMVRVGTAIFGKRTPG